MLGKLRRRPPDKVTHIAGYLGRMAASELTEMRRGENVSRGFPAKPGRTDGVSGRVIKKLDELPDGEWLIVLFRIMSAYPYSPHHTKGRWPFDGFLEEHKERFPEKPATLESVRTDVNRVLTVASETAGRDWVFANLTLPLNSHGEDDRIPAEAASDADQFAVLMGNLLRKSYARNRAAGCQPAEAFQVAAEELSGADAPSLTREVRDAIDDLEHLVGTVGAPRSDGLTRLEARFAPQGKAPGPGGATQPPGCRR